MAACGSARGSADAKSAAKELVDEVLRVEPESGDVKLFHWDLLVLALSDATDPQLQADAARAIIKFFKTRSSQFRIDEFKRLCSSLSDIKAARGLSDLVDEAIFSLLSSAMSDRDDSSSMRDHLLTHHVDLVRRAEAAFAKDEALSFLRLLYGPVSPLATVPIASWIRAFDMVVELGLSDVALTGRASKGDGRLLLSVVSNRMYGNLGSMTLAGAHEEALSAVHRHMCPHAGRLVDVLVSDTASDAIKGNALAVLGFIFSTAYICTRGPQDGSQLKKALKEPIRLLLKDDMRGLKATAKVLKKCYEVDLLDVEGSSFVTIPFHLQLAYGFSRQVVDAGYLPAMLTVFDDERLGSHSFHRGALTVAVVVVKLIVENDSEAIANADVAAMLCRLLHRHAAGEFRAKEADHVIDNIVGVLGKMILASSAALTDEITKEPLFCPLEPMGSKNVIAQQTIRMLSEWVPPSTAAYQRLTVHPKVASFFEEIDDFAGLRMFAMELTNDGDRTAEGGNTAGTADAAAAAAAGAASAFASSGPKDRWKSVGNALFGKFKYLDAYRAYIKGVRLAKLESISELLVRRAQCRMGVGDCVGAMIDVTTALRILPPPPSVEPGSKSAIIQQTAVEIVYTPLVMRWLNGLDPATGGEDVMVLPSEETTAAFMKDAMQHLCARVEAAGPSEPLEVADALAAGQQLQEEDRFAEASDIFTAGLAAADVSTLIALLSNASACLLKPELIREGGPDAVGCAAAALHLSCLHHDPSQQLTTIQQKCLVRLGQGLLAERLFDAADVIARAIKKHVGEGQMRTEADTLQQRIRTHRANAKGDFDWAAIYRQQLDNITAMQHGRPPTSIDVAEYVGPVVVRHDEAQQPSLYAKEDIQVGQLLLVQKPVVIASGDFASLTSSDGYRQLMAACKDGWHPRLVSQLCCLSEGQRRPSTLAAPPSHETCLGLVPGFPLLPRFMQSHGAEEFGSPVAQVDGDSIPQLVTFNHRMSVTIRGCLPGVLRTPDDATSTPASGVWILPSLIRHARYDRNAIWYVVGDLLVVRASRAISRGGGVTADYFDDGYEFFDAKDYVDDGDAISMAERWGIPSPSQHDEKHIQEASRAIGKGIHRVGTLRRGGASPTAILRDSDALMRKMETLQQSMTSNVPTMRTSELHIFRGMLLCGLGRHDEASEATIEAVKTARAVRSIGVGDCRCLSTTIRSAPHDSQLCDVMLEELRRTCALVFDTPDAANMIFLNQ
ncbi:unnamed protein product [Vitrella brassicaformis CCMP3155]|uniref:Uncharacterized protein n=1 Tax=Vitrella brassicaformis (strain CCMP3155) TaxID=1169540 RepID=A0A0G4H7C2_VITBC|nr:unnamed protein product [Vitrella brassicaformis CCMP3155]|eukprot:CEM39545.1 unnamed protein product [Vitrella brassicaformis CCMP3155]